MNKITGILLLLVSICVATALLNDRFLLPTNIENVIRYSALYAIIGIGVSVVIITGGIDLSIGSLIGLTGCILPMLLVEQQWSIPAALTAVLGISLLLGMTHGLLITKLNLQPFIVTLCGLLIYRGLARWLTVDQTKGFGSGYENSLRLLATGRPCSIAFLILCGGLLLLAISVWKLCKQRGDQPSLARWQPVLATAIMGLTLAVIGSSRYWQGVTFTAPAAGHGGWALFSTAVPPTAAEWPQRLMQWFGLGLIPSAVWLLTVTWPRGRGRMVLPVCGFLLSTGLVFWARRIAQQPDDWFLPNGNWAATWRMTAVLLTLGLLLASIGWLARQSLSTGGAAARTPLQLCGFFAILWLLGQFPLARTLVPAPVLVLIVVAALTSLFLNQTIYGRYLYALGRNEEATRLSGVRTDRMIILAYMLCALASALGGVLFALEINSIQPSGHGNFLELYAIAAAVLGGCSLRGGEGTVGGVIIGAAVMRVLYNSINILKIPTQLEYAIIGAVILAGVLTDELVKRFAARRQWKQSLAVRRLETSQQSGI